MVLGCSDLLRIRSKQRSLSALETPYKIVTFQDLTELYGGGHAEYSLY